jgi:uncharacterized membrane protein
MNEFLTADRLKLFSDSVLLVGEVLLVYNLATLATSEPEFFELDTFFNALVAYISSFIVIFFYWSRFTFLLDHIKSLNETIIFISLAFLIVVTLTPVSTIGLLQVKSQTALVFSCVNQILAGLFLILLLEILTKDKIFGVKARYFFLQVCMIPLIYITALLVSYLNFTVALVIPLSILPIFLLIRHHYSRNL